MSNQGTVLDYPAVKRDIQALIDNVQIVVQRTRSYITAFTHVQSKCTYQKWMDEIVKMGTADLDACKASIENMESLKIALNAYDDELNEFANTGVQMPD